tara:strand:+ start:891 stop:1367 length:477 start_codon:yes stop_codon:yes gene_type:complete
MPSEHISNTDYNLALANGERFYKKNKPEIKNMPRVSAIYGSSELLKSEDIGDRRVPVTIESVGEKQFDDGDKLILQFVGKDKALVLNRTNANAIRSAYGDEADNWVGKDITLYSAPTMFKGTETKGLRVSIDPQQAPSKPASPAAATFAPDPDDDIPF